MRLWFLVVAVFLAGTVWAETASTVDADPHFSLLLQNNQVRVYSLVLRPQQRVYDRYDHSSLLLTLHDSQLYMWPDGAADITSFHLFEGGFNFFFSDHSEGLRNQSNAPYHGVLVEFLDPRVTTYGYQWQTGQWDFGYTSPGAPVDPHARFSGAVPLGSAAAVSAQLLPGDPVPALDKSAPALLVPITDIDLKGPNGAEIRRAAGEAVWLPDGSQRYVSAARQPIRLVLIDFAPPAKP